MHKQTWCKQTDIFCPDLPASWVAIMGKAEAKLPVPGGELSNVTSLKWNDNLANCNQQPYTFPNNNLVVDRTGYKEPTPLLALRITFTKKICYSIC